MNYNLQPYDKKNVDTTGRRNLKWLEEQVWPTIREEIGSGVTILDVGCGNGRFNTFLKTLRGVNVLGIDAVDNFNKKEYGFKDFTFQKCLLGDVDGMFDVVLFIGSFNVIWELHGNLIFKFIIPWLLPVGGKIIVMVDKKQFTSEVVINRVKLCCLKTTEDNTTTIFTLKRMF